MRRISLSVILFLSAVVFGTAFAADLHVGSGQSALPTDTVEGRLFIDKGGAFNWHFGASPGDSAPLYVADYLTSGDADYLPGNVTLYNGSIFRPIATLPEGDCVERINGWTVLTYDGWLLGTFSEIDDSHSPFYEFELDYSVRGQIRVNANLLSSPKALSDVVTTGLSIANRKVYRQAFQQLTRETYYGVLAGRDREAEGGHLGQQPDDNTWGLWAAPVFRATRFASSFHAKPYDFETYGFQLGSTFWSDPCHALGLIFGYERGLLRNGIDSIRSHDYYLGLYYGRALAGDVEFRAYLGGGHQRYTMFRSDAFHTYTTGYQGTSFELNLELARMIAIRNGLVLRPFAAMDVEYGDQESAQEKELGDAFRYYSRASLSQMFVRFGADLEKRWQRVDLGGSFGYTFLAMGRTRARSDVFYPTRGVGTTSYGTRLGRHSLNFRTGLNWYLNPAKTSAAFIDYLADVYLDRSGDPALHTASFGMTVRF